MIWVVILITLCLLTAAIFLLAIKILVKKKGQFPNSSVSQNPEMSKRGITCATTFDRIEQKKIKPDLKKFRPEIK